MNNNQHKKNLEKAKEVREKATEMEQLIQAIKKDIAPGQLKQLKKSERVRIILERNGIEL